jgi:phosphoheptose isomerase
MKGFLLPRPMDAGTAAAFDAALSAETAEPFKHKLQGGIRAISLPAQAAVLSAYANDVDSAYVYAQLVYGYGKPGDLFIGLSTSGNSANVVNAAQVARACGLSTLALTGERESKLSVLCNCTVRVPDRETFRIQELHLPVYHYLCAAVEWEMFGEK